MSKINYSKIEEMLEDTFRKMFIERLSELADIANLINNPKAKLTAKVIESIIKNFQEELQKLKNQDKKLFKKLEITAEEEVRFMQPSNKYTYEDWERLRVLKEKIDELKVELFGEAITTPEDEKHIEDERKKHLNKRHNIRDDWLPLH